MLTGRRTVTRAWPDEPAVRERLASPRRDLLIERACGDGVFEQETGPFGTYRRRIAERDGQLIETTEYHLAIPWFGWLFALPVRALLGRRNGAPDVARGRSPWWAPPDQISKRQALILGLLAAASMSSAFTNTLFTQTVKFAADDFGVGNTGVGVAGSIVRAGIVIAIPFAVLADRVGRQRVIRVVAWAAPTITALGALAPSFPLLVATQAIGRPLGLALDFLIAVVAAEEMPRNSRAYAVSVLAMASGLGAGIAVMALPLADLGDSGWRFVYLVTLIWLVVAVDIARRLPETKRFERPHRIAPPLDRRRFAVLAAVAVGANFFVAPASFFQNSYLRDIRGFDAGLISLFTLTTATPAGIGLIVGGRLADIRGRRRLIAVTIPIATALVLLSFSVDDAPMWLSAFGGGFVGGIAFPALAVYRAEMFPTGNRGRAAGLLTASALIGGIGGLLLVGQLLDRGLPYSQVIGLVSLGQLVVVVLVLTRFPETAHRELEDLNPEDVGPAAPAVTESHGP
ncbi:MAG: MFS transporter [Ilumatobacter sp.]|uniref:MFS transporter n=1 Tax=Ilumatobacter sp. TaxID=1967498 RepID=UPI0026245FE3|nr:MFS transporter [Ilumatobacter sp.]MDJ0768821.1 MFS transporter [Ilumatobacter sp.]